jgi:hypothetical protein
MVLAQLRREGTKMIINETIAEIERQNGDTICQFLATAHARLVRPMETGNQDGSPLHTPETD